MEIFSGNFLQRETLRKARNKKTLNGKLLWFGLKRSVSTLAAAERQHYRASRGSERLGSLSETLGLMKSQLQLSSFLNQTTRDRIRRGLKAC